MSAQPLLPEIPRPDVSEVNTRGFEIAKSALERYCDEVIDLIADGVGLYLEADKELERQLLQEEFPEGATIGTFVLQDTMITAPRLDGQYTKTFYTRLEPEQPEEGSSINDLEEIDPEIDQRLEDVIPETPRPHDKRHMNIHVAVGGLSIYDFVMPETADITQAFVQTVDGDESHWYVIARGGFFYEYVPPTQSGEERGIIINSQSSLDSWADYTERVPESLETLTQIFKHIVNWKTMPQRLRAINRRPSGS